MKRLKAYIDLGLFLCSYSSMQEEGPKGRLYLCDQIHMQGRKRVLGFFFSLYDFDKREGGEGGGGFIYLFLVIIFSLKNKRNKLVILCSLKIIHTRFRNQMDHSCKFRNHNDHSYKKINKD